jgi:hypothetical protein
MRGSPRGSPGNIMTDVDYISIKTYLNVVPMIFLVKTTLILVTTQSLPTLLKPRDSKIDASTYFFLILLVSLLCYSEIKIMINHKTGFL